MLYYSKEYERGDSGRILVNSMKRFTLYLGLNDKDTKVQEISTLEACKIVNNLLVNLVDGATIFEADGIYKHDDGTIVIEKTLRIELLFVEMDTVKKIVETLKVLFNQESIAVQVETVESMLM